MIDEQTLDLAIQRGIVSAEQANDLRALVHAIPTSSPDAVPDDDEKLRFITGFSDIFVTLGIGLFTSALGYFAMNSGGRIAMWFALAVAAWLLAEFFTRRRRMALPSIALLCLFAVAAFGVADMALARVFEVDTGWVLSEKAGVIATAALLTLLMTGVHYWRFRVPITIAAGAASLALSVVAALAAFAPDSVEYLLRYIVLFLGLGIFALALRFDLSDPRRETRRTDIAFWLHLLAAPMIVHSMVFGLITGSDAIKMTVALGVLAIFFGLAAVAVAIDRRALLVSGLAYAGYAFADLIRHAGMEDQTAPATILALGAFVLLLSAGWHPIRRTLLGLLPVRLTAKLPHPLMSS